MEPILININGYSTYYTISRDDIGEHLLIAIPPNANKNISDICNTVIDGKYINQVDYIVNNGIRFIKAYY